MVSEDSEEKDAWPGFRSKLGGFSPKILKGIELGTMDAGLSRGRGESRKSGAGELRSVLLQMRGWLSHVPLLAFPPD